MNRPKVSHALPLGIIVFALFGAGISYHLNLESRFSMIEQKLDQSAAETKQFQATQLEIASQKNEELSALRQEIESLKTSLESSEKVPQPQAEVRTELQSPVPDLAFPLPIEKEGKAAENHDVSSNVSKPFKPSKPSRSAHTFERSNVPSDSSISDLGDISIPGSVASAANGSSLAISSDESSHPKSVYPRALPIEEPISVSVN